MTVEEALVILDATLGEALSDLQEIVFCRALEGRTYAEIAENAGYETDYIKYVGHHLWQLLSKVFGEKVTKSNCRSVLRRVSQHQALAAQPGNMTTSFSDESTQTKALITASKLVNSDAATANQHQDWGEAIDVSVFYGRVEELSTLAQWIAVDHCRLVAVLGLGGIGKTTLSVKLAKQIQNEFEYVIWRSLRNAPPIEEILTDLIQSLSNQQEINLPVTLEGKVLRLLSYFRQHRCLVLLDNVESVLQIDALAGCYSPEYKGYSYLFSCVGGVYHQSCLIFTSREKPEEISLLEGPTLPVRSLQLRGLTQVEGQQIFKAKGCFGDGVSAHALQAVFEHYAGNPLALKIVASVVQEVLGGDLAELIPYLDSEKLKFTDVSDLLERQFKRLCASEQRVMYWLAVNREPLSISELAADMKPGSAGNSHYLLEVMQSLVRRCVVERNGKQWFLQPVVTEYITSRLIKQACEEIIQQKPELLQHHALMKALSKDYVRQVQSRLILQPILDSLLTILGNNKQVEAQIKSLITLLRTTYLNTGYSAGNLINLLCTLKANLTYLDCSQLAIWQAYLVGVNLHEVNFAYSEFINCAFPQAFSGVLSVVFSPDGETLATSNANGEIQLWRIGDGQCLLTCRGHTNWIRSIAFSPNGQLLASAADDHTIKIWDAREGTCVRTLGLGIHSFGVKFSPDGKMIATGSDDQTIRVWDIHTGDCIAQLQGHQHWVLKVDFSPDGQQLISGSADGTVRIWDVASYQCLHVLDGHQGWVFPVAYSSDGQRILSGSMDCTLRVWDAEQYECLQVLEGHTGWIWSAAFSPNDKLVASTGVDQTIRIWNVSDGRCVRVIQGHTDQVWSLAFHPKGHQIASGGDDQTIRIWDVQSGQCISIIQGCTNWVRAISFNPDGYQLVSAHKDGVVRIWDVQTYQCLHSLPGHIQSVRSIAYHPSYPVMASSSDDQTIRIWQMHTPSPECTETLRGHTDGVWTIAYSPDGQTLASAGCDRTIRLWNVSQRKCRHILEGHTDRITGIAFNPYGRMLASSSEDQTVKLWDTAEGRCINTLTEHTSRIVALAFHPDGYIFATGGMDNTIKTWDVNTGQCLTTLVEHQGWPLSLAYSPCGHWLVSGSSDRTVKVWDTRDGKCVHTFVGHKDWIWSVAIHPNSKVVASAGSDEAIKLWDLDTGDCVATLRAARPFECMDITGVTGLTKAQREAVHALGAVESDDRTVPPQQLPISLGNL